MGGVDETRVKVLRGSSVKLVKGTPGMTVWCLLAVGQRQSNLVTYKGEQQSANISAPQECLQHLTQCGVEHKHRANDAAWECACNYWCQKSGHAQLTNCHKEIAHSVMQRKVLRWTLLGIAKQFLESHGPGVGNVVIQE